MSAQQPVTAFDRIVNELVQTLNASNEVQDIRSMAKTMSKEFIADNNSVLRDYVKKELARNHKSLSGFWCNNVLGSATIYGLGGLKDTDFKVHHPRLRVENKYGEQGAYDPQNKQNACSHIEDKFIGITRTLLDKYFHEIDLQIFDFVQQNIVPKIESDLNKLFTESNLTQALSDNDVSNISSHCNTTVNAYDVKRVISDYVHEHHPNILIPSYTISQTSPVSTTRRRTVAFANNVANTMSQSNKPAAKIPSRSNWSYPKKNPFSKAQPDQDVFTDYEWNTTFV